MSDHIERTELANIEYRAKTGEVLREESVKLDQKIDIYHLGSAMARASADRNQDLVELIKGYWRERQTWRNQ